MRLLYHLVKQIIKGCRIFICPLRSFGAQELLSKFSDVFSKDREDYGRTSLLTHSINTDGAAPIKKTPYRLPQSYMQAAEQHFKEMAEDGLIVPCISPWRAPILMVRKKDGSLRFCTDFRGLNSVTVTDAHP